MIAIIVIVILASAVGTIVIGLNPGEKKYGTKTKGNLTRLSLFYVISTLLLMVIFFYYWN